MLSPKDAFSFLVYFSYDPDKPFQESNSLGAGTAKKAR